MITNGFGSSGLPNINIDGQVRAHALSPMPDPGPVLRIYWTFMDEENQPPGPKLPEVREKVLPKSVNMSFACISPGRLELTVQVWHSSKGKAHTTDPRYETINRDLTWAVVFSIVILVVASLDSAQRASSVIRP